jgi:hypothetical protein
MLIAPCAIGWMLVLAANFGLVALFDGAKHLIDSIGRMRVRDAAGD